MKQFRMAVFQSFGLAYDKTILHIPEPVRIPFKPTYIDKYTFHTVIFFVFKLGWMIRVRHPWDLNQEYPGYIR